MGWGGGVGGLGAGGGGGGGVAITIQFLTYWFGHKATSYIRNISITCQGCLGIILRILSRHDMKALPSVRLCMCEQTLQQWQESWAFRVQGLG